LVFRNDILEAVDETRFKEELASAMGAPGQLNPEETPNFDTTVLPEALLPIGEICEILGIEKEQWKSRLRIDQKICTPSERRIALFFNETNELICEFWVVVTNTIELALRNPAESDAKTKLPDDIDEIVGPVIEHRDTGTYTEGRYRSFICSKPMAMINYFRVNEIRKRGIGKLWYKNHLEPFFRE
jgi:hypothetical protein